MTVETAKELSMKQQSKDAYLDAILAPTHDPHTKIFQIECVE
jgi:hypothetical protein